MSYEYKTEVEPTKDNRQIALRGELSVFFKISEKIDLVKLAQHCNILLQHNLAFPLQTSN